MSYLLSIVIPTKDRYFYLKHLINLIKSFNSDEIELVIQDNTANNAEILKFIKDLKYQHLKYFHIKKQVSMSENSDLAILHSSGEYICYIGDDDGVLPNIIDCVNWMKDKNIDALRPAILIYNWPDFESLGKINVSSALLFDNFTNVSQRYVPINELKKLSNLGFTNLYTLPKVYQGIVKKNTLNEVYKKCGTFFPGPSPDMANSVALSFVVNNFVISNTPVIIIGQSKYVGGGERKLKQGYLDLDNATHLSIQEKQSWDPHLPKIWCSDTVWPESAIKAIQRMGHSDEIIINYERILAYIIIHHRQMQKVVYILSHNKLKLWYNLLCVFVIKYYKAAKWRIEVYLFRSKKKIWHRDNFIKGVQNIKDANNYIINRYPEFFRQNSFSNNKIKSY